MNEVNEAAKIITASADEDAKIIFGTVIDEKMKDELKVTVVATGFGNRIRNNVDAVNLENRYTPNTFISEKETEDKKTISEKKKPKISSLKAAQAIPAQRKEAAAPEEEEDELGIPAFIRKKMM
ncbi:MAG: Cell division protein FtsZ [Parcubacteria group bacterium ADurb.Bin316]|nr:MAG: Cell division protein FtsZ [Parcubacteria group bacterium ADurb.Bin316]